jgi:hypothetical protein
MINLKSMMSNLKYTVSAIVGLLFLVGYGAVSDIQPQYAPVGVYDSNLEAGVAVTSEPEYYQNGTEEWQNLYASLLRYYAELSFEQFDLPIDLEWDWYFILHDINQDGIPELFIVMQNLSGHTNLYAIYTFSNGEATSLEFDKIGFGELSILAPLDNSPWIILSYAVGSGASLTRMKIDGNALVSDAQGLYHLSDEGFEREYAGDTIDSFEGYVLTLDGNIVEIDSFEAIFGQFMENKQLVPHAITEANIANIIFGSNAYNAGTKGIIIGNIVFNNIEVSRLRNEPFTEILGSPIYVDGTFIFYEGFELSAFGWVDYQPKYLGDWGRITFINLNMPELNGVMFNGDMNVEDVIAMFGNPVQYYGYPDWINNAPHRDSLMSYQVISNGVEYRLEFWFYDSRDERPGYLRQISVVFPPQHSDITNEHSNLGIQLQLFYSDDELVEAILYFLSVENSANSPIFWWLRGWNIDVDNYASGITGSEFEYFQPVGRFNSIFEMKTATEQIVSNRFAEEHLYPVLYPVFYNNPRMFLEHDGQLFLNTLLNGGWMMAEAVYGSVVYRNDYEVKMEITYKWSSYLLMDDMYRFEVYLVRLVNEDGFWKIDTWPGSGRTFNNPPIRWFM